MRPGGIRIEDAGGLLADEAAKKALFEKIVYFCLLTQIPFYVVMGLGDGLTNSLIMSLLTCANLISLYLSKKGRDQVARVLFVASANFLIFIFAAIGDQYARTSGYFNAIICMQIVIGVGVTGKGLWITLFALVLLNYLELSDYNTPFPKLEMDPEEGKILRIFDVNAAFLIILFSLNRLHKTNQNFKRNIRRQHRLLLSQEKFKALGEMAGGIAHEINNPLAIIRGRSELMKERFKSGAVSPPEAVEDLEKIEQTVERIAQIVKGLRTFSRDAKADPMTCVDLKEIVEETLDLCRDRFEQEKILLRTDLRDETLCECRPTQISQILLNLLNNAFDAVYRSTDLRWVSVELSQSAVDRVQLSVTDSGPGIHPSLADQIMKPFFTTKQVGEGTGLGLSISKSIAEDHSGTLRSDASSAHTRFVLELPIHQAIEPA
jgi:signal transduction histidine kinase